LAYSGSTPILINNTITENYCTVASSAGAGVCSYGNADIAGHNNIVYGNEANSDPDWLSGYGGAIHLNYTCSGEMLSGRGNITDDPLFVDPVNYDFNLQTGSPCIDAGDPASPLDPDGTIADMGAFYYDQSGSSPVIVTLVPYNPPIQVPASGGSFDFNIEVANNGTDPETFDIWTMATLPNGSEYGPIIYLPDFTAPASWSSNRDRTQAVPATAPTGLYTYDAYVGVYPDDIWDEDHFDFEKLADGDGSLPENGWMCWGESFEELAGDAEMAAPEKFALHGAYPNPFNPATAISYQLPADSRISLSVYDVSGSLITTLVDGWRDAGLHEVAFDGTGLTSGVYIYRIETGDFTSVKKMVLMK
jgi:hypothetical protein